MIWCRVQTRIGVSDRAIQGVPVCRSTTHVDAARQALCGELQLELELVESLDESAFSAKNPLVLKKRSEAISVIAPSSPSFPLCKCTAVCSESISGRIRVLEDLDISVQGQDEMGDAEGLEHLQHDAPGYEVAGGIAAVGVVGLDVELGEVAGFGL
jgi:hypothetical protein